MAWVDPHGISSIEALVRKRIDRQDDTTWWTPEQAQQDILDAYDEFWDLCIEIFGEDFDEDKVTTTVTAGVAGTESTMDLPWWDGDISTPPDPADPRPFRRLKRLDFKHRNKWYPLQRMQLGSQVLDDQPRAWLPGRVQYRLQYRRNTGPSVVTFHPAPSADVEVRAIYLPSAPITIDPDPPNVITLVFYGYEEWIVRDLAAKLMRDSDEDASQYLAAKAEFEAKMRRDEPKRDVGQVPTMGNVDIDHDPEWGDFGGFG